MIDENLNKNSHIAMSCELNANEIIIMQSQTEADLESRPTIVSVVQLITVHQYNSFTC